MIDNWIICKGNNCIILFITIIITSFLLSCLIGWRDLSHILHGYGTTPIHLPPCNTLFDKSQLSNMLCLQCLRKVVHFFNDY